MKKKKKTLFVYKHYSTRLLLIDTLLKDVPPGRDVWAKTKIYPLVIML